MEYPIQLFMDMAWKPSSVSSDVVGTHTTAFCIETFGKDQGPEAARLLNQICKVNGRSTAEMLDARTYALDEWPRVISEYQSLEIAALEQFSSISSTMVRELQHFGVDVSEFLPKRESMSNG